MAQDKATEAAQPSKGVLHAVKTTANDYATVGLVKLEDLREEFAKMINEPVSVKDLGELALKTVKQLGKIVVHYTAQATKLGAQVIVGFCQLLLSICYVAAMLVTSAARATKDAVTAVFIKMYHFASKLVARNGEATAADVAEADQIEATLVTAS